MAHSTPTKVDFIVIGGGSSGALIAGRLAAETNARVLLLEAGHRDMNPLVHIPSGYSKLLQYGWFQFPYMTVPQTALDSRPVALQQGKGLGGGSSINAMMYVRGQSRDYHGWQEAAGDGVGWSYDDLLPHFVAMEGNESFSNKLHESNGPLKVSQPAEMSTLNYATIKAFQEIGLPYNSDYNGEHQRGVGPCQLTIGNRRRCSSADAFLHPVMRRRNLTVCTAALATQILLEGDRAVGVDYLHRGRPKRTLASHVLLCAGAINSPRLLMLSGIGPKTGLSKLGIKVQVHALEVGRNLQDHPQVPVMARARTDLGYAKYAHGLRMLGTGVRYLMTRDGPAASNGIESVAYFNPDNAAEEPTIQCIQAAVTANAALGEPDRHPGLTLENVVLQPRSRGEVTLRDADPRSEPLINPNYLSDPEDMRKMIAGLRYARQALQAPSLRTLLEPELSPGLDVQTDEALAEHSKRTLTCMWHPIGHVAWERTMMPWWIRRCACAA